MAPSKKHVLAAAAASLVSLVLIGTPSYADPAAPSLPSDSPSSSSSDVSGLQAQVQAKQHELEKVNEEHLDAKLELDKQNAAKADAEAKLVGATEALETAKANAAQIGAEAYKSGALNAGTMFLAGQTPEEYIDKASAKAYVDVYHDKTLAELAAAESQTEQLKAEADAAQAAAAASAKTIADKKAYIEAELPKLEEQLAALGGTGEVEPVDDVAAVQGGSAAAMTVVNWAMSQRGKPYQWGAAGPNGYDCSGLTLAAYRQVGISLPHSSSAQRGYGSSVSLSALQPGDLVFAPGHVAIYIGNGTVVHAPTFGSPVRTMPMSYMGFSSARRLV